MAFDDIAEDIRLARSRHSSRPAMLRGLKVPYFRRGEMAVPAFTMDPGGDPSREGRARSLAVMGKAASFGADLVFFDLEDASPDHPEYKAWARTFTVEALRTFDFGGKVVGFRPNNIRSEYFEEDLIQVLGRAGHRLDVVILPKTEYAEEVADAAGFIRRILERGGHGRRLRLEVLIESPRAFLEAERIAAMGDVTALILGAWDLARTIGGRVDRETWTLDQACVRQQLPVVAASCGKEAVDAITGVLPIRPPVPGGMGPEEYSRALALTAEGLDDAGITGEFGDRLRSRRAAMETAAAEARSARRCGYAAKWILHPDQIGPIQDAWTPTRESALEALRLAVGFVSSRAAGMAVAVRGNLLADKAVVGTEWWTVESALRGGTLTEKDINDTGCAADELRRALMALS
ncbi:MAG: aldolase/citrate lyase family protein [Bacteroidota bacterium]